MLPLQNLNEEGVPQLLETGARLLGFGTEDQKSVLSNGIPKWAMLGLGVVGGVAVGVWLHQRYPERIDSFTKPVERKVIRSSKAIVRRVRRRK